MSLPIRIIRYVIAFVLAVAVSYALGATFYTQLVLSELQSVGVDVPMGVRISESLQNIVGMTQSAFGGFVFGFVSTYPEAVALGLLGAYLVAMLVKAVLRPLSPIAYPVAGAVALGVIVYMIHTTLSPGVFAGARALPGIGVQMIAGLIGGIVFATVRPHPARD